MSESSFVPGANVVSQGGVAACAIETLSNVRPLTNHATGELVYLETSITTLLLSQDGNQHGEYREGKLHKIECPPCFNIDCQVRV